MKQDLVNKTFGRWTVLEDTGEKTSDNDTLWLCKCICGTIKKVRGNSLRKGASKSCGCLKKDQLRARAKNIAGQKFDMLVALEPTEKRRNGTVVWKCRCDCGNICERDVAALSRPTHHSCGCYNKIQITNLGKKNLVGQKFGLLTVIRETEKRSSGGSIIWECKCDCGNLTYVSTNSLTTGNTSSCGCINYSIGEKHIEALLKENNIKYIAQFSNPELKLKRFDFAIINDNKEPIRFIEFDGEQHYNDLKGLWNSTESLEIIQKRDQKKNQYAKEHNIPLIRIPYWERDNITLDMIMGDKFLVE